MELDRYGRALVQRWYVLGLLIGVGIIGSWLYVQFTSLASASATVAVMEPAASKSLSGGAQAQVNYASIAESRTVAQRVIQQLRLDVNPDALLARVSVKLSRTLVPSVSIPLYTVKAQDRDPDRAVALANAVVEQSRQVFLELNVLDRTQVDQALQAEERRLRTEAEQARADLRSFEEKNRAWRLDAQIQAQLGLVTALRQTAQASSLGTVAAASVHSDVSDALSSEQDALTRLRGLQPEYDRLTFEVNLAAGEVSQLSGRESDLAVLDPTQAAHALGVVRSELGRARARLDKARAALAAFQSSKAVNDLNAEIANRMGIVSELRRQSLTTASGAPDARDLVASEQSELDRLFALVPTYEQLGARVNSADALFNVLQTRKFELVFGTLAPAGAQVKVLDPARLESDTFFTLVLYALGALLGLCAGLAAVYLMAYFDGTPYDVGDVEALYPNSPLVVRVPNAY